MKFTEPRYNADGLKEASAAIIYIVIILLCAIIGQRAQAQDKILVDRWRLEKACKELILLDSLVKDYALKDSTISQYKNAVSALESQVVNIKHVSEERSIQIENLHALNDTFKREVDIWKGEARRQKRLKIAGFALSGGLIALLILK